MSDELIDFDAFNDIEREAVDHMVKVSVDVLRDIPIESIDSIALIINDHEGNSYFTTEIWINSTNVVSDAVSVGIRRSEARWLYEHWRPEAAKGEILTVRESPTQDRGRYYSLAIETIHEIRKRVPEVEATVFLIDNNHDYDSLVVDAITAANPNGQAVEWLANPPPDC